MTIDAYQRVHAAVRRRWGSHQDARDAASEAYARWLANPADKTAHDVRSHVRYMVMHAGQILSPTGRRAAGRLMRPLAGRFGLGVDAGGDAGPAEDAWRAWVHGVAGGAVGGEQEDATVAAVDALAAARVRLRRPTLDAGSWREALGRLRADGWTQPQIAAACGVTVSMAGKWLRGAVPRLAAREIIARVASVGGEPPCVTSREVGRARAVSRAGGA